MRRYLVVADETLGGEALLAEIRARHDAGPSRFVVVVPASVPREGLTWTEGDALGLASDRLERVLSHLDELGIEGTGTVADADAFMAIQDTLRDEAFDEVILSAPSKRSGWMKSNLPRQVEGLGPPVTFVAGERDEAVRETALTRIALFSGLRKRHSRALARMTMVESYRPGTTIVEEGSVGSDLYVILDGRVNVTMGGRTVDHLSVGDAFGEISLLAPGPHVASVSAEAPTRCLALSGADLHDAMAKDAQLASNVLEAVGIRMRELSRSLRDSMSGLVLDGDLLEELAESAHIEYVANELSKGARWGEPTDDYLVRHESLSPFAGHPGGGGHALPYLVPYEDLPEQVKEQNRDLVREIPKKLASAGYVMRPLGPGEKPATLSDEEIEDLAEREHDRWMRLKIAQGWSFAGWRDDGKRHHPNLVPWRELSPEELQRRYGMDGASRVGSGRLPDDVKQKDRALMTSIGSILARAGFTTAKVGVPVS